MRRLLAGLFVLGALAAGAARADDDEVVRPDRLVVRGPSGRPVAGTYVVEAAQRLDDRPLFDPAFTPVARADASGRVEALPRGTAPLVVWAPGHAATVVPATSFEAEVRLASAAPIDGRVRFARGAAARGVAVYALRVDAPGPAHRTRTDADGRYAFEALAPGLYAVSLLRSDGRRQPLGEVRAGDLAPDAVLVGSASVRGRLLDGDGIENEAAPDVHLRLVPLPGGPGGGSPRETTSDAEGHFLVGDLRPGMYRIDVEGPGFELDQEAPRIEVRRGRTQPLRPIFVRRTVPVVGVVLDADRKPVVGAVVRLLRHLPEDPAAEAAALERRPEQSSGDGRYRIPDVSPGEGYRLVVTAEHHAPWISEAFRVARAEPTAAPVARLGPGWALELRVRDTRGVPVVGAAVLVVPTTHPAAADDPVRSAFVRRARTDAEGRARVADLLDADAEVTVTHEGFLPLTERVPVPLSGRSREEDVTLAPAPRLTGRVVTADGRPGGPYRVRLVQADGSPPREVGTDTAGRFAFETLAPVESELSVRAASPSEATLARRPGVLPGEDAHVEIELPSLLSIQGTVEGVAADGAPAHVLLEAPERDVRLERFRWRTVASVALEPSRTGEAAFVIADLAPGPYALRAVQGGRDTSALSVRLDDAALEDVRLEMPPGARVAGTVLGGDDRPVPGAEVVFERQRGDGDVPGRPGGPLRTTTDADGAYVMDELAPGLWRVTARRPRRAPATAAVRVAEGDVLVVDDLVLDAGASVEGRVRTGDGRRVDGALLRITPRDRPDAGGRTARTDAAGVYRFAYVAPGLYTLTLESATGALWPVVEVEVAGDETLAVDFEAGALGRIEGTVTRGGGRRLGGALLELLAESGEEGGILRRYRTRTARDGTFSVRGLAGGRYRLRLRYGSARLERVLWLAEGDRLTVDVEARAGRLVGRVEDRFGGPVPGADVRARALDPQGAVDPDGAEAYGRTDPQGAFVLSGLPVGWYRVEVAAPGLPPGVVNAAEAELAGAERPVTVVMGRGGDLALTVLDPGKRGVTGARVWVENASGTPYHPRPYLTGPGGRLLVEGVPAGAAQVRVQARGFGRPAPIPVSIAEGDRVPLRVDLAPPGTLIVVVVGRGRDPVTRARVDVLQEGTGALVESRRPLVRVLAGDPRWGHVPKTGRLVVDELEAGAYEIVIDAGDTYPLTRVGVDVAAGEVTVAHVELVPR